MVTGLDFPPGSPKTCLSYYAYRHKPVTAVIIYNMYVPISTDIL